MRKLLWMPAASLLLACTAYAAVTDATGYTAKEQARLDKLLAKRTPGQPLSCVNMRDLGGNEGFGDNLIVFKGRTSSSTVYVNRPPGGCPSFRPSTALKTRTPSTRLCRGDIVEVFDPVARFTYGGCGLGDFVPYAKRKG